MSVDKLYNYEIQKTKEKIVRSNILNQYFNIFLPIRSPCDELENNKLEYIKKIKENGKKFDKNNNVSNNEITNNGLIDIESNNTQIDKINEVDNDVIFAKHLELLETYKATSSPEPLGLMSAIQQYTRFIYCYISYPLSKEAIFKILLTQEQSTNITFGELLRIYTFVYQTIYSLENKFSTEDKIIDSEGTFGIHSHHITKLVYNGYSTIVVLKNNDIHMEFGVNSQASIQ